MILFSLDIYPNVGLVRSTSVSESVFSELYPQDQNKYLAIVNIQINEAKILRLDYATVI